MPEAAIRVCLAFADPELADRVVSLLSDDTGLDVSFDDVRATDVMLTDQARETSAPSIFLIATADSEVCAALPSTIDGELLRAAIRIVAAGFVISDGERASDVPGDGEAELTPRESEVLSLLMHGLSNKSIARELDISVHTAKFHVASLMAKLGARNRADAIAIAIRRGLVLL
jgi:DNA-binding NarL/FixJ family response regulator